MHLKVAEIGENFDVDYIDRMSYFSFDYLLDCDILIIDLNHIATEIQQKTVGETINHPGWIQETTYQDILTKISARKKELLEYFNTGGNIYVQLPSSPVCTFFAEGDSSTPYEMEIDLFDTIGLDSKDFALEPMNGSNIVFADPIFTDFFQAFDCSYQFSYAKYKGAPAARINNTKHPISIIISKSKGNILLMPKLRLNAEDYNEFQNRNLQALKAFQKIDQELKIRYKATPDIHVPDWCSRIYLSNESEQLKKLNKLFEDRDKIQHLITEQQAFLSGYTDLKELLFETGTRLEERVKHIFTEFGFEILFAEERRDDLIIQHRQDIGVIEIKGLKSSSGETNAAQLMKWVTTYHHDHGIQPKGFLIVNAFKDIPLADRKEKAFPPQMLTYCKKMGIALITTTQLLGLYLDFKRHEITLKKIHSLLWGTIGVLEYVPSKINSDDT